MSKHIILGDRTGKHSSLELDDKQVAALKLISDQSNTSQRGLIPVFDSICKAYYDEMPSDSGFFTVSTFIFWEKTILTCQQTRPATDLSSIPEAAMALNVGFRMNHSSHALKLEVEHLEGSIHCPSTLVSMHNLYSACSQVANQP